MEIGQSVDFPLLKFRAARKSFCLDMWRGRGGGPWNGYKTSNAKIVIVASACGLETGS